MTKQILSTKHFENLERLVISGKIFVSDNNLTRPTKLSSKTVDILKQVSNLQDKFEENDFDLNKDEVKFLNNIKTVLTSYYKSQSQIFNLLHNSHDLDNEFDKLILDLHVSVKSLVE